MGFVCWNSYFVGYTLFLWCRLSVALQMCYWHYKIQCFESVTINHIQNQLFYQSFGGTFVIWIRLCFFLCFMICISLCYVLCFFAAACKFSEKLQCFLTHSVQNTLNFCYLLYCVLLLSWNWDILVWIICVESSRNERLIQKCLSW